MSTEYFGKKELETIPTRIIGPDATCAGVKVESAGFRKIGDNQVVAFVVLAEENQELADRLIEELEEKHILTCNLEKKLFFPKRNN